jgi:hypothetical protein
MSPRPKSRPRCPFYGFHWPVRGSNLRETGTAECGLDLVEHGPCLMERRQEAVNFEACPVQSERRNLIEAGRRHIRFHGPDLPADGVSLDRWQDLVMRQR